MKRTTVIISIVLAIALVGVAFQITQAQRQRQPGGQRQGGMGGMRAMQAVEQTWAGIAFEVKVDSETLEKARPHLQKAWDDRKQLMKDSAGDFRAIADGMIKIKADLDGKLKTILTDEQIKKLAEWEKSQQQTRRMGGGPMGGGGRGGGMR
ncbi:hypothetical protein H8E77_41260 [bacterium]|nr:hypothetical protein [bacterium]